MANEEQEILEEPRDYTKWIWAGIAVLIVGMLAALWWVGRPDPKKSMVHARHILVRFESGNAADRARALERISELKERIESGADFASVAREYSDDAATAPMGGDLGYSERDTFDENFEKAVWETPVGELTDIIETQHGFHIALVEDRQLSPGDRYQQELEERAREKRDAGNREGEPDAE